MFLKAISNSLKHVSTNLNLFNLDVQCVRPTLHCHLFVIGVLLVSGKWSVWTSWSDCSEACGDGESIRSRTCTEPSPLNGSRNCTGEDLESRFCKLRECSGIVYLQVLICSSTLFIESCSKVFFGKILLRAKIRTYSRNCDC